MVWVSWFRFLRSEGLGNRHDRGKSLGKMIFQAFASISLNILIFKSGEKFLDESVWMLRLGVRPESAGRTGTAPRCAKI